MHSSVLNSQNIKDELSNRRRKTFLNISESEDTPSSTSAPTNTDLTLSIYYKNVRRISRLDKKTTDTYFLELRQAEQEFWEIVYGVSPSVLLYWREEGFPRLYQEGNKKVYKDVKKLDQTPLQEVRKLMTEVFLPLKCRWTAKGKVFFEELVRNVADDTVKIDGSHALYQHVIKIARTGKRPSAVSYGNFKEYAKNILRKDKQIAYLRNRIVDANLRLVLSFAYQLYVKTKGYAKSSYEDLVQYGNLGLIDAVNHFDPSLGYSFSTYAKYWIRSKLLRGHAVIGKTIRMSHRSVCLMRKMKAVHILYKVRYNRQATDAELLKDIEDLTASNLNDLKYAATYTSSSLQQPVELRARNSESDHTYQDIIEDDYPKQDEVIEHNDLTIMIREGLADTELLDQRERQGIRIYYGFIPGETLTFTEIGAKWGVSRECARKIIVRGVRKLHMRMLSHNLVKEEALGFLDTIQDRREKKEW